MIILYFWQVSTKIWVSSLLWRQISFSCFSCLVQLCILCKNDTGLHNDNAEPKRNTNIASAFEIQFRGWDENKLIWPLVLQIPNHFHLNYSYCKAHLFITCSLWICLNCLVLLNITYCVCSHGFQCCNCRLSIWQAEWMGVPIWGWTYPWYWLLTLGFQSVTSL